jgi:carboxypeptidase Q
VPAFYLEEALKTRLTALVLCALVSVNTLPAAESVDLDMVTKIRQEGFRNSKVMETASDLMDGIGPRLTGSPNMKAANDWTRDKLKEWGLSNAHLESWGPFGRGWAYESCSVRMISPDIAQLIALPQAWTGGTNGPVRGLAIRVSATTKEEIEKFKGKLSGKVVIYGESREIKVSDKPLAERYDEKRLEEYAEYKIPGTTPSRYGPNFREEYLKRREVRRIADKLFAEEKALAVVTQGAHDGGTLSVQSGGTYKKGDPEGTPNLAMDAEHFGRIVRLLEKKKDVELEVDVKVRFIEENQMQWNTIAEIPGTDKKGEVVMLGAHLDSWHGGTGATDNGAGSVVAMEAVRILQALGVKPKRTIRIGLWSGEEQGLLGSRGYVSAHFASRPEPPPPAPGAPPADDMPSFLRRPTGPLTVKPEHAKLAAYFNLDNGTGKVRGIYTQENAAVVPIFQAWLEPLKDLGATAVTLNNTSGTDHLSFDAVGLPGFQFIQDEIEYDTRTHHTNMDVYERLQKADLMQASVVMATFVYQAAMRDAMLPRKPMPKDEPTPTPTPTPAPVTTPAASKS